MADDENNPVLGIIGGSGLYDIPGLALRRGGGRNPFNGHRQHAVTGALEHPPPLNES